MATINGTSGNDSLNGGSEGDTINGFEGDDTINAGTRPTDGLGDTVDGGEGIDTLVVNAAGETQSVSLNVSGSPSFYVRSASNNFYIDAYNVEKVSFTGGSGDDNINSNNGGVTINGGGGIDWWHADYSAIASGITFILGSTSSIAAAGLSSITNVERMDLATGIGNDTITGAAQGDSIWTSDGDDTVDLKTRPTAGAGDTWDGGAGTDTLVVNASAETQSVSLNVSGSPSYYVRSTSNNFYVDAYNVEKVKFTGGSGDDTVNTYNGGVTVNGRGGIDWWLADLSALTSNITFTLGTTTAIADAGLTSILNIERISLTTGTGRDTIVGGAEGDSISTGDGNDTVDLKTRPVAGAGDFWDGGAGSDTLVVDASAETQSVDLNAAGSPSYYVRSTSANFYLDAFNVEKVKYTGGSGNDTINTNIGGVTIDGGGGIDWWYADYTASKTDLVFILGTTTTLGIATSILNIERINLSTGTGNDQITGGAQGDSISTGKGNDTVDLKTRPTAGAGDFWDGDLGTDTLVVDASAETQSVSLNVSGSPSYYVRSASGNFYSDVFNVENVRFTGGSGDDSINTNAGGLSVDGGGGIDFWFANYGASTKAIVFRLGTTTAIGAVKLDSIQGIEGINLTTGSGNDFIRGGAQADSIFTGDGNDTIDLATRPTGGGGDTADGGAGIDLLIVNGAAETQGVQVFIGGSASFAVRSTSGNFFADAYGMEKLDFTGGSANDDVSGGAGTDSIVGGLGADTLSGGAAADTISGGFGNDTLNGNDGNDIMDGGKDLDLLRGGKDADTLTGGGGADVFDYDQKSDSNLANQDTIIDFTVGADDIDLRDFDANSTADGYQAFSFIGAAAFSHVAGQLRAVAGAVEADLNGDGTADFRIIIGNGATLGAGDFILV